MAVELTDRDKELIQAPELGTYFPLVHPNGVEWSEFTGYCAKCNGTIPAHNVRGFITQLMPSVFRMEAVGICEDCRALSRFFYRLHDDKRLTGLNKQGRWSSWTPRRKSSWPEAIWGRLLKLFR